MKQAKYFGAGGLNFKGTKDGGQTWEEQTIPAEIGKPYLTRDGMLLTISPSIKPSEIIVLRYVVDDGG